MEMHLRGPHVPFEQQQHIGAASERNDPVDLETVNNAGNVDPDAFHQESQQDLLPDVRERNRARQLRHLIRDDRRRSAEEDTPEWERYPVEARISSATAILGKRKALIACYGVTMPVAGALIGGFGGGGYDNHPDAPIYAGVGTSVGIVLAALLTWGLVCESKAKESRRLRALTQDIDSLPYSFLALPGPRGIRNAPELDAHLRDRLADLFDVIPRNDANGKRIAALLTILHEDAQSAATKALAERLRSVMDNVESSRILSERQLMNDIDIAIASWKKAKTGDITAMVLYQGIQAAGVPAHAVFFDHDRLADGLGKVSDYLNMKNSDYAAPVIHGLPRRAAMEYLSQQYQRWKDHLDAKVPGYDKQLNLVRGFISEAMNKLHSRQGEPDHAIQEMDYLRSSGSLAGWHKGDVLARWYAEECLKNPAFVEVGDEAWVERKLIEDFQIIGLPERNILQLIEESFTHQKGRHIRENVATSQSEDLERSGTLPNKSKRPINTSCVRMSPDTKGHSAGEIDAMEDRT